MNTYQYYMLQGLLLVVCMVGVCLIVYYLARKMAHGLCVKDDHQPLFDRDQAPQVKTKSKKIKKQDEP